MNGLLVPGPGTVALAPFCSIFPELDGMAMDEAKPAGPPVPFISPPLGLLKENGSVDPPVVADENMVEAGLLPFVGATSDSSRMRRLIRRFPSSSSSTPVRNCAMDFASCSLRGLPVIGSVPNPDIARLFPLWLVEAKAAMVPPFGKAAEPDGAVAAPKPDDPKADPPANAPDDSDFFSSSAGGVDEGGLVPNCKSVALFGAPEAAKAPPLNEEPLDAATGGADGALASEVTWEAAGACEAAPPDGSDNSVPKASFVAGALVGGAAAGKTKPELPPDGAAWAVEDVPSEEEAVVAALSNLNGEGAAAGVLVSGTDNDWATPKWKPPELVVDAAAAAGAAAADGFTPKLLPGILKGAGAADVAAAEKMNFDVPLLGADKMAAAGDGFLESDNAAGGAAARLAAASSLSASSLSASCSFFGAGVPLGASQATQAADSFSFLTPQTLHSHRSAALCIMWDPHPKRATPSLRHLSQREQKLSSLELRVWQNRHFQSGVAAAGAVSAASAIASLAAAFFVWLDGGGLVVGSGPAGGSVVAPVTSLPFVTSSLIKRHSPVVRMDGTAEETKTSRFFG